VDSIRFYLPSGRTKTLTREIFDRIGPSARLAKAEATAPLKQVPLVAGALPAQLVCVYGFSLSTGRLHPGRVLHRAAGWAGILRTVWHLPATPSSTPRQERDQKLNDALAEGLPRALVSVSQSFYLQSQAEWSALRDPTVHFYEASPRLAIASYGLIPTDNPQKFRIQFALDLRRDEMRAVSESAPAPQEIWDNVLRGVFDGVLEHEMLALQNQSDDVTQISTVAVMNAARATADPLTTIKGGDAVRVDASEQVIARITADLQNSGLVVVRCVRSSLAIPSESDGGASTLTPAKPRHDGHGLAPDGHGGID